MGVIQQVTVSGSVSLGPVLPSSQPSSSSEMDISTQQVRAENRASAFSVNSPAPAFQDLLLGMSFSAIRFVSLKNLSGTPITIRISTPAGGLQLLSLSDELILSNPAPGSEITLLQAQGVANLEAIISGDS